MFDIFLMDLYNQINIKFIYRDVKMFEKIIGGVTAFLELILVINSFNSEEKSEIFTIVLIIINVILILVFALSHIYIYKRNNILRKNLTRINKQITLCDRNLYYSMKNSYKKDVDISTFNSLVMQGLKEYVNGIADLLSQITRRNVTVSIRFFEERTENLSESILKILTYSKNCTEEREELFTLNTKENLKVVKENTDFFCIVGSQRPQMEYFYQSNLEKYDKIKQEANGLNSGYFNTTKEWKKYYNCKIVIPIQMENNKLFFKKENEGIDIIGFLCVDAEKAETFPNNEKDKRFFVSLLESYANRLYIILNKYNYYLAKRKEGKIHEKKDYEKCV